MQAILIQLRDNGRRSLLKTPQQTEMNMAENVYKVIELIGTSTVSWEKAAAAAIARAGKTLRDLRVAEVVELDIQLKDGKVEAYRAKIKVSFKYERGK
jgi:flavin-binding protein dodecin